MALKLYLNKPDKQVFILNKPDKQVGLIFNDSGNGYYFVEKRSLSCTIVRIYESIKLVYLFQIFVLFCVCV